MSRSGLYIKQLAGYKAFIPKSLPPKPPLQIDKEMLEKLNVAKSLLTSLDVLGNSLPHYNLLISMYVKKEALLSTQIEGSQASLEDVLEFEAGDKIENINDVEEVVNYIKALNYGIKRLETLPMGTRLIKEIHEILLKNSRGHSKTPGEFKRSQNWIGPSHGSLKDAIFVPPPPEETKEAISELEKYMHSSTDYDDLINCALIHYQFETIHPFLDGNGRVGRLLITLYLIWKGTIKKPLIYASYYLKKHRQEYYDRLMMVRNSGNYEQWVKFFLKSICEASNSAIETTNKILHLQDADQNLLMKEDISTPIAIKLLKHLFDSPIISINDIEKKFSITYPTAAKLIEQFVKIGILKEITGKKRSKKFIYQKYVDILSESAEPI